MCRIDALLCISGILECSMGIREFIETKTIVIDISKFLQCGNFLQLI